jgi:hypothetical protein
MRNVDLAILSAILIMTLAETASGAQSGFKKELDFTTGGNTIGGPGIAENDTGDFQVVWNTTTVHMSAAVCATAANVGDTPIILVLGQNEGEANVRPGRTRTLCSDSVEFVSIHCGDGDPNTPRGATCETLWRVDQYRPGSETNR